MSSNTGPAISRQSDLQGRYHQAAKRIRDSIQTKDTERGLEFELFALERLLKRQAELLIEYYETNCLYQGRRIARQDSSTGENQTTLEDAETPPQPKEGRNDGSAQTVQRLDSTSTESKVDLSSVTHRLTDIESFAYNKFYAYKYDEVPAEWMGLYTDAQILQSYCHLLRLMINYDDETHASILDHVIYDLDHALIKTGGRSLSLDGSKWINETFDELKDSGMMDQKLQPLSSIRGTDEDFFDCEEPFGRPAIQKPAFRMEEPCSVEAFEYMLNSKGDPEPIIIPNVQDSWPARNERPWTSISYLMYQTLGGRRLVPIEIGKSYVDKGWGQDILSFKEFLADYVLGDSRKDVGYLAQHDLFRQIPSLRNDILIPDYCWVDAKGHPIDSTKNRPKLETPSLNAWFGPANTVTPLHTDGYHNLLCQVVGTKYVRLYHPSCTETLRPRGVEDGVDMSNTSSLDLTVLLGWDKPDPDADEHELSEIAAEVANLDYVEAVLEPGDTLYIPLGWWHYVRSASISFSVSFWWN